MYNCLYCERLMMKEAVFGENQSRYLCKYHTSNETANAIYVDKNNDILFWYSVIKLNDRQYRIDSIAKAKSRYFPFDGVSTIITSFYEDFKIKEYVQFPKSKEELINLANKLLKLSMYK